MAFPNFQMVSLAERLSSRPSFCGELEISDVSVK
jgi:hypothetical protein